MNLGRTLMLAGAALLALGAIVWIGDRLGIRLGRLPGDITIYGRNSTFYFPLGTGVLVSVVLTLVLWFAQRK